MEPLRDLNSQEGTFFVTGNHEYFVEDPFSWLAEMERLGVQPLRNEHTAIRRGRAAFHLAGVNDVAGESRSDAPDFDRALSGLEPSRPTVLLAHQPVQVTESVARGVDLQVSGHTCVPARHGHVRPVPASPPVPLAVQAVLGVLVGLSVVGGRVLLTDAFGVGPASLAWVDITLLVVVVGVAVALRGGLDRDPATCWPARSCRLADAGLGVDAAYLRLVATPVLALARLVAFLDTEVVDAYVRATAVATRAAGWAGSRGHHGERPSSAVGLVLAAVVVLGLFGVLAWS